MEPIIMPQVGHHIKTGQIVKWHKKEKDRVEQGDLVLTVESEKASFEVEAESSGVLIKILYTEGEEADVLKPVGYLGEPGETYQGATAPKTPPETRAVDRRYRKVRASPVAKRTAKELGVLIEEITGTGPGGRVVKQDVLAMAGKTAPPVQPIPQGEDRVLPFSKRRQIIADRMTRSKQSIPHFYLFLDVSMDSVLGWRRHFNAEHGVHVTITDVIVQASAKALREFSTLNAHVESDRIVIKAGINVGVAAAVEDDLLVPVIVGAEKKDIRELSREIKEIVDRARRGILNLDVEGTFTVTSLGMFGIPKSLPIINPPECAILGVGAVEPRVVARDGFIGIGNMMTLTLAIDHRAVDGVHAAQFLQKIKHHLENDY